MDKLYSSVTNDNIAIILRHLVEKIMANIYLSLFLKCCLLYGRYTSPWQPCVSISLQLKFACVC